LSRFPQSQRHNSFLSELDLIEELLLDIKDLFPNAKLIFKKGNHEIWFDKELWSNPKLAAVIQHKYGSDIQSLLDLTANGWDFVDQRQAIYLGKLLLLHGHEMKKGGKYVANAALEYYKCDVAFNHFHRIDFAKFDVFGGQTIRSYALPCACDTNANYTGINNQWVDGFAICEFRIDDYTMDIYSQTDGKIRKV